MSHRARTPHRRAVPIAGLAAALVLGGCATPYELREFAIPKNDAAWGWVYVSLHSQGQWKEGRLTVQGAPYSLSFAPRLKARPAADCVLTITDLRVRPAPDGPVALEAARLTLSAGPPRPREPNHQDYSPHFKYVVLEKMYLASVRVEDIDLPYAPVRLTFKLGGGPTCPEVFRTPIPYDMTIQTRLWKGKDSPWPSV